MQPHQVNDLHIASLVQSWRTRYSQGTLYLRVQILRRAIATLESCGARRLDRPRTKPPKPRATIASQEQLAQLLTTAPGHVRLFILLAWQMGLRFSECLRVTPQTYDAEHETVSILVKGGHTRIMPVTKDVAVALRAALPRVTDTSQPFISILAGKELKPSSVRSAWQKLCRKLKIEGVHPHDLRRTIGTTLFRVTHDLRAVQQYLGHESMRSTVHYIAPFAVDEVRNLQSLLQFQQFTPKEGEKLQ